MDKFDGLDETTSKKNVIRDKYSSLPYFFSREKKVDANDCHHHHNSLKDFHIVIIKKSIVRKETGKKNKSKKERDKHREEQTQRGKK